MADVQGAPTTREEEMAEAWAEGRLDCPVCPVCGRPYAPGDQMVTDVDVVDVYDEEPLWPGGPVVPVSLEPVRQRVVGRWVTGACGHRVDAAPGVDMRWVMRPRTSDTPPPVTSSV